MRLSAYIAELKPTDFTLVCWRGRLMAAHLVCTYIYKLGARQALIVKESAQAAPETARCWASSDLEADLATVAFYASQRWDIETWIEDAKDFSPGKRLHCHPSRGAAGDRRC